MDDYYCMHDFCSFIRVRVPVLLANDALHADRKGNHEQFLAVQESRMYCCKFICGDRSVRVLLDRSNYSFLFGVRCYCEVIFE